MGIGWLEVSLVVGLAVLIFGPKKIPEFGSALGKTLRGFKEEMQGETEEAAEPDESKIIDR